jgi:hypothetical protein
MAFEPASRDEVRVRMTFRTGDRVRISNSYPGRGAGRAITTPPEAVQTLVVGEAPWNGCHRFVPSRKGLIEFFCVQFDERQIDADGDGPYSTAEIDAAFLEPE